MPKIKVLVPVAEVRTGEAEMVERPQDLSARVIGFLWNHKPNGNLLLKELEELLLKTFRLGGTLIREKTLSSSEAPLEVLDELSLKSDLVILAMGD